MEEQSDWSAHSWTKLSQNALEDRYFQWFLFKSIQIKLHFTRYGYIVYLDFIKFCTVLCASVALFFLAPSSPSLSFLLLLSLFFPLPVSIFTIKNAISVFLHTKSATTISTLVSTRTSNGKYWGRTSENEEGNFRRLTSSAKWWGVSSSVNLSTSTVYSFRSPYYLLSFLPPFFPSFLFSLFPFLSPFPFLSLLHLPQYSFYWLIFFPSLFPFPFLFFCFPSFHSFFSFP